MTEKLVNRRWSTRNRIRAIPLAAAAIAAPTILRHSTLAQQVEIRLTGWTSSDALASELSNGLRIAVLEHLEGLARQVDDQMTFTVGDGGGDAGDLDTGPKRTFGPEWRLSGQRRARGDNAKNRPARTHGPCYHQPPRDPLPEQDLS